MTNKLKRIISLLMAMMMLFTVTACGKDDETDEEGMTIDPNQSTVAVRAADAVFSLGYDKEQSLNPLRTKSQANYIVDCLVYEFAVDLDSEYNWQPNIITVCDTENGYSWMFTIDTTVTFHDGSYVTPEDVAWSIDQARYSDIYSARLNKIWGISAMGDNQVMITLSDTNYLFPSLLNVPIIKKGSDSSMPEGTGQYMFDMDMTKLVKYEDHRYADNTPLDVIYLQPNGTPDEKIADYASSVVDLAVNDPTSLSRLGYGSQNEVRHFPTTNMQYVGFNMAEEFTCYPYIRKAISYAVDREYIAETIYNGSANVATMPIPPTNSLYNKDLAAQFNYNLGTAARLFASNGVQDYDGDGICEYQLPGGIAEITLDFIVAADNTDKVKAAKRITEDLNSIGIPVKLRQLSWTDYVNAIVYEQYDMFYGEIKLTADFSLIDMLSTNGVKNFYNMSDPQIYDLVTNYLGSRTETDRRQNCDIMCQYIAENGYIIPICFEEQQVLTHRDVVSGLQPTQYNLFYNFKDWTIDPEAALVDIDNDGDYDLAEVEPEASEAPQTTKRPIPTPSTKPIEGHIYNPNITPTPKPEPASEVTEGDTDTPAPSPEQED